MKYKNILIIGVGLAVILVVVIWVLFQREGGAPTSSQREVSSSTPQAASATATPTPPPEALPTPPTSDASRQLPGGPYAPNDPRWAERRRLRKQDPKYEWKTPIEFYGRVVDQDQQPISGVEVEVGWTDMSPSGSSTRRLVTGADGRFSMRGERGKALVVHWLRKKGYEEAKASNRYGFEYAAFWEPTYHESDPDKPVIFHLRRKGEAEPMVKHGPTLFAARTDGEPTAFEIEAGRKVPSGGGDIALRLVRGPKEGKRFDWGVTVEAVGGAGLVHSDAEFMATAPTEGYQSVWSFTQSAVDEDYQSEIKVKFFVRTAEGKHARVEMRIIPEYQEQGAVDLVIYFNPSGSTNLEFDPLLRAK